MQRPVVYIPFAGTRDWSPGDTDRWWQQESPHADFMASHGFKCRSLYYPWWATALAGTVFAGPSKRVWYHGALVAADWIERNGIPIADRNLIAYSHGGQVAKIVATFIPVRCIVTIGTPIRKDMREHYEKATGKQLHVYSTGWENRWQAFGSLFDKDLRLSWQMPFSENKKIQGIGHGDVLEKPDKWHVLNDEGVLSWIKSAHQ